MRLKSFYGSSMTEAMQLVRKTLGDAAIIVATRDDEEQGGVRVTAAIDENTSTSSFSKNNDLSLNPDLMGSDSIEIIATALVENQISPALAEKILATATQLASEDPIVALGAALDTHFTYDPIDTSPQPLIFIGPPGAGKTLTTAKLAAQTTLSKKKTALISTDTQRAGGMAQLGAFARILKTDIMEIEDIHALQDAVSIQPSSTVVLIDTAGCNPFNASEKQELEALLKKTKAEPVLVLPADMDSAVALDMAKEFKKLGAKRLICTRLDITQRMGGLLKVAHGTGLPLSLFSATAKVTEAPLPFNPVSLARLILPKQDKKQGKVAV
ncbi:MAG TPA: GTPase [Rhodospirillaceae bacterium]|nr:GTPase [Rhodospirillaceae bacterium]